jgi:hypothetical protein
MALFTGKRDKKLPLLTQFYQLEFDPNSDLVGSELDIFLGSLFPSDENKTLSEWIDRGRYHEESSEDRLNNVPGHPDDYAEWENSREAREYRNKIIVKTLKKYSRRWRHVKAIMGAAIPVVHEQDNERSSGASQKYPWQNGNPYQTKETAEAIYFLNGEMGNMHNFRTPSICSRYEGVENDSFVMVRLDIEYPFDHLIFKRPCDMILLELVDALKERAFAICEECNSVFQRGKTGQRFCSHRCQDRNNKRRRYKELFAGYQG